MLIAGSRVQVGSVVVERIAGGHFEISTSPANRVVIDHAEIDDVVMAIREAKQRPPEPLLAAVQTAIGEARKSPCAKSKRGVAIYNVQTGAIVGEGYNHPPALPTHQGGSCDGTPACRASCSKRCIHAEDAAIRLADRQDSPSYGGEHEFHLVHVKIDDTFKLVAGGGPSCWQCSRTIVDANITGVWLYEDISIRSAPSGKVIDTIPGAASWRYYTAAEFHEATLKACGIHPAAPLPGASDVCRNEDCHGQCGRPYRAD